MSAREDKPGSINICISMGRHVMVKSHGNGVPVLACANCGVVIPR